MEENKNPELEVRETDKEGNSGVEESLAENNESIEAENAGSGKKGGRGTNKKRPFQKNGPFLFYFFFYALILSSFAVIFHRKKKS